jgi:glucose-1-phosphate cytidylyltransferase
MAAKASSSAKSRLLERPALEGTATSKPRVKTAQIVILCGGAGARLKEETEFRPKPLVEVGGRPILWHIMKIYSHFGFTDFILCLGYKGQMIKQYFLDYLYSHSDFTMNLSSPGRIAFHGSHQENRWNITLADTGLDTMTGGRIRRIEKYVDTDPFFVTYGDGVADINLKDLLAFHKKQGKIATMTGVQPQSQFGMVEADGSGTVLEFKEKPVLDNWVNGGFFVFNRSVFRFLDDASVLEKEPLTRLAKQGELSLYRHRGFWKCLDTFKDLEYLNQMWSNGKAPWRVWTDVLAR